MSGVMMTTSESDLTKSRPYVFEVHQLKAILYLATGAVVHGAHRWLRSALLERSGGSEPLRASHSARHGVLQKRWSATGKALRNRRASCEERSRELERSGRCGALH